MIPATFITSATKLQDFPQYDRPQVAIVGRSNVGKSSLINHLMGRKDLARVSATAGKTVTINVYEIDRRYLLIDLPGYGYVRAGKTKRAEFSEMVTGFLTKRPYLKLVLSVIDASIGPTELDREMFAFLRLQRVPYAIIVNKIDRISKSAGIGLLKTLAVEYPDARFLPHSIETGAHRAKILEEIETAVRAK